MSSSAAFDVRTLAVFEKQAKRLIKKYPSLKDELVALVNSLKLNPEQGTQLSGDCYKIRLSIQSKGKGKRGGARIITHLQIADEAVYLLTIYDKSEQENLTDRELKSLLGDLEGL